MNKHKTIRRFLAMALSVVMAVGMLPVSAAAEVLTIGAGGEIIAFEKLAEGTARQTVSPGTTMAELDLPETLTATVRFSVDDGEFTKDSEELGQQGAEEPEEPDLGDVPQPGEGESNPDELKTATASSADQADESEMPEQTAAEPEWEEDGTDTVEMLIPVPVEWVSSPEYDKDKADTYIFTAETQGFTVSVPMLEIRVTVGETAAVTGMVTAFDDLPDELRWQNTLTPDFPQTVSGTVEGNTAPVPVTWEADHLYDTENPERGLYVFTAEPGEGYALADGVQAPRLTVYIPQRIMGRMAGSGTAASPLEITTAAQLAEVATLVNAGRLETFLFNDAGAKVSLELMNDIDLSAYTSGEGWLPIGGVSNPFKGIFDGGGHKISGLTIDRTGMEYQGLFGYVGIGASVKNLGIENATIVAKSFAGGVAGHVYGGTVQNCYTVGSIKSTDAGGYSIGGVVGRLNLSTLQNCYSIGSVDGANNIGGVAGAVIGGSTLQNCYSAASVNSTAVSGGGVVGYLVNSTVTNCYSTGDVSGNNHIGGVVGLVSTTSSMRNSAALNSSVTGTGNVGRVSGSVSDSILLNNIAFSGMAVTVGGSPKSITNNAAGLDGDSRTAAEIGAEDFFQTLFEGNSAWTYETGKLPGLNGVAVDMPIHIADKGGAEFLGSGTELAPWQIRTAAEMKRLSELVNAGTTPYADSGKHYRLMRDIDLSDYATGEGWVPIGNSSARFNGSFDGGSHKVTGLFINRPGIEYQGMFGYVAAAGVVKRLGVDAHITGKSMVGTIAGYVDGTVEGCGVTGSIVGAGWGTGGVAGVLEGTIRHSYSAASVSGAWYGVGGVAGSSGGTIEYCYATGSITGAVDKVGGVVGFMNYSSATVERCAALNTSISGDSSDSRVAGYIASGAATGNVAFSGIPGSWGSNGSNGEDKSAAQICQTGFFQALFGSDPTWTYADGKLPGLFGAALPMPPHITETSSGGVFWGAGTSGDPYQIRTAADLAQMAVLVNAGNATYLNKYYKLMNDLDLSGYAGADSGAGWTPIGTASPGGSFRGHFDGGGKVITGLFINRPSADNQGLFGIISTAASVKNLGVVNASITGADYTGGVAGQISVNSTVESCYTTGRISGGTGTGGLVGVVGLSTTLKNCYSASEVSGIAQIGGVAGRTNGTVQNCYATGKISGSTYSASGVAGEARSGSTVSNCAALNTAVTAGTAPKRVTTSSGATLAGNVAFSGMPGTWNASLMDGNKENGASITLAQIDSADFWRSAANWDTAGWDESVWTLADGKLPVLKNAGGAQSGDGGLGFTQRDIAHAVVQVTGTHTYTGSAVIPTMTVTFDSVTLTKDEDYTVSSGSINVGAATATLTGTGNFTGTKDVTFTIGKAAGPAVATVTGSSILSGTTHTYTVDSIPGAQYRMGSGDWQDSNVFHGIVPGSSHSFFARIKETENYEAGAEGSTGTVVFEKLDGGSAPVLQYTVSTGGFPKDVTITPVADAEYQFNSGGYSPVNTYISSSAENVTLYIRLAETATHKSSAEASAIVSTEDQSQAAPDAFTLIYESVNDTAYTVTIPATTGAEYSFDGVAWSSDNTKTDCLPGSVTGYKRVAAKPGFHESPAVSSSVTLPMFRVKTPAASPNGSTFIGSQIVTLSSETVGAAIYYTTDGSTPTAGSTLYTVPFSLTSTSAVKAIAVKAGMEDSGILSVTFTKRADGGSGGADFTAVNVPGRRPNQPVMAAMPITAAAGVNGSASVSVPDGAIAEAIFRAQADAKTQGKTANGIAVELNIVLPEGTASISSVFSASALQSLADAGVTRFCINSAHLSSVCFDLNALKAIQRQSSDSVIVSMTPVSNLSEGARNLIGTRPVYDIAVSFIKDGNTVRISDFNGGIVTISIPYTVDANEAAGYLYGVYVDEKGNASRIDGSAYDANSRSILISTGHLSVYGVGYTAPGVRFTDINGHWAKENINYAAGRGLIFGTSENAFSPDVAMTREVLVTALGRLAGIDVNEYTSDGALSPYAEWAYRQGIIQNNGSRQFVPDSPVTREEMALILQNYARAAGYHLPVTREAAVYADASSIGSSYKNAVTAMQQAGIMMGGSGRKFNPKASATRGEVSAMLHRYIKLTIDPETAQDWALNDAGQWLYFMDGRMASGKWLLIDGKWYYFYADGSLAQSTVVDGWEVDENGVRKTK
ncbi:MAG: S-layer homology domain-containing protein [Lacrimispora sp.]|uniref:S-layer homology domain-containing protein n=1 Tax=Lacrimispora sp. TaxID=2719234 RepID=UPI0039E23C56